MRRDSGLSHMNDGTVAKVPFSGPRAPSRHALGVRLCLREAQREEGQDWGHASSCKAMMNSYLLRTHQCQELIWAGRVEGYLRNSLN